MNRLIAAAALTALLAASSGCAALPSRTLTPTTLIASIGREKGRNVTVSGYFTYDTDTRALWENEDAYLDARDQRKGDNADYWAKCITVYAETSGARAFDRHRVRITGKATVIDKQDMRSLWTCNQVALEDAVITPAR